MTLEELQAKRDAILKQMAAPASMQSGDKALTNRSFRDLQAALASIDGEIRRAGGTTATVNPVLRFTTDDGI